MSNASLAASEVPSPCTGVCRIGPDSGLCEGCCRTLDEIAAWSSLDAGGKRAVWLRLDARRLAGAANGPAGLGRTEPSP